MGVVEKIKKDGNVEGLVIARGLDRKKCEELKGEYVEETGECIYKEFPTKEGVIIKHPGRVRVLDFSETEPESESESKSE